MVDYFIKGGNFMWPILIALIIGLVFVFERFWTLMRASINARKFNIKIAEALRADKVDEAIDICQNTRGPIANVIQAGLVRMNRGIDAVEKSVMTAGTIEMAFLERNLVWLATVVSIAPMIGFLGTVSGMVGAFDAIAKANDISPSLVAGGISEALLTTMFGLIVAIIVQFFHNFFIARIDKIVADMEESTQEFVDLLVEKTTG
ncbi:MAG: MotA/TolQ/ExbB proton channel family protein [Calditrichaeota bacterium]|jgi:biopolymer transport protein ExbB|nr:MotA/TolQ/ExbB proton channel family protein [Calditrichota bacterium]MBT7787569.1 MotA/TolQ/ExbB proton channel family protein [Calditrichota bacterium]